MVDTGGSVVAAVEALWAAGAQGVTVAALHMLLSGRAWERLNGLARAARERGVGFNVVGTSTVVHRDPPPYYRSFSLVPLMAQVIGSVNTRGSVADVVRRS
jgi:phosphoribosylpyrophosphate synthetase